MTLFYREFDLDRKMLDETAREVTLSFSSEQPVIRHYYDIGRAEEILLHGSGNVDLSRLKKVGALLYGHRPDQMANIIGPIKSAEIRDRRGYAVAGLDVDTTGETAMTKIKSGSLRGVSFGYQVHKARVLKEGKSWLNKETGIEYTGPKVLGTRWTPYEISLTPVPADATVGVGREVRSLEGIEIINQLDQKLRGGTMTEEEIRRLIEQAQAKIREEVGGMAKQIADQVRSAMAEDARPKARIGVDVLADLLGRAGAISVDLKAKVADLYAEGRTEQEIMTAMLDAVKPTGANDSGAGPGSDGTGRQTEQSNRKGMVTSFKGVNDEDFWNALKRPMMFN